MSFKVFGIGELLWDMLPSGKQLGGAPGNFVYHAAALGADAHLITRIGDDPLGQEALSHLRALNMDTRLVEIDPRLATGQVGVELSADGQAHYTIHENVAWDAIQAFGAYPVLPAADVVCFGTLAQRYPCARNLISLAVQEAKQASLKILDINLRAPFINPEVIENSLKLANVLKLNENELPYVCEIFGITGNERSRVSQLAARFQLRCVAYTRGENGSLLWHAGEWSDLGGSRVTVADTIGAGDSFTAAMALGLMAGWPLALLHQRASQIAAYVCTQPGATPSLPDSLRAPFLSINQ